MSFRASNWAVEQRTGAPAVKAVLMCLADKADEAATCFPSQEVIAWETEISVDTVQRALKRLVELGLIEVEPRTVAGRGKVGNRYRLLMGPKPQPAGTGGPETANGGGPKPQTGGAETAMVRFPHEPSLRTTIEEPSLPLDLPSASLRRDQGQPAGSKGKPSQDADAKDGPDYDALIWNEDAPALAEIAGCSLARAKSRIGALLKANSYERKRIHEALRQAIHARPAGCPFAYATTIANGARAASSRYVP